MRHSDARSGDKDADAEECEKDAENSHRWHEGLHKGDKNDDKQCGGSGTGGTGGTPATLGTISGFVFFGSVYTPGIAGVLGGSVVLKSLSGAVVQTTVASFSGSFTFNNSVPAGSYLVCDVPPTMFFQALPANNGCYPVTIGGTVWAVSNLYFGLLM